MQSNSTIFFRGVRTVTRCKFFCRSAVPAAYKKERNYTQTDKPYTLTWAAIQCTIAWIAQVRINNITQLELYTREITIHRQMQYVPNIDLILSSCELLGIWHSDFPVLLGPLRVQTQVTTWHGSEQFLWIIGLASEMDNILITAKTLENGMTENRK